MKSSLIIYMVAITLTFSGTALAQNDVHSSQETSSPLTAIYACTDLSQDQERLACYDSQVKALKTKETNKEIVALDANTAQTLKKEAFGFSLPSLPKLGLPSFGHQDDGPDILSLEVKSVRKTRNGYVIHLKNGQIWKQSGGRLNYIPKGDLTATIKSAAMGSYILSLSNGKERVRGLRVKRVE